jgi:hypothetical protein
MSISCRKFWLKAFPAVAFGWLRAGIAVSELLVCANSSHSQPCATGKSRSMAVTCAVAVASAIAPAVAVAVAIASAAAIAIAGT